MPEVSWDDPEFQTATTKEIGWYQVTDGNTDIIRIIGKPFEVQKHTWEDGKRFRTAMCSMEKYKSCPYCSLRDGDPRKPTAKAYAATIFHISRTPIGGKGKYIGKLLAWRFGDDKKNQLVEIHHATGQRLNQVELRISLDKSNEDAKKYQKLIITKMDKSIIENLKPEMQQKIKTQITKERDGIIKKFLPSPDDLKKFMKDFQTMEEQTSFDPSEMDDLEDGFTEEVKPVEEKPKAMKNGKRGRPKKVETKPEEELEEEEDDLKEEKLDSEVDLGDLFSG